MTYQLPPKIEHLSDLEQVVKRLPTAPLWAQAIVELAQRCREYVSEGWQSDAQLAAQINELHVQLIEHPRGERESRCR